MGWHWNTHNDSRRGVVGRVPAFQPSGPGYFPGWVRNFNIYSWDWVCVFCVLSSAVSGGDPDIVLTTHSGRPALMYLSNILVLSLLLPLQASDLRVVSFWGCNSYVGGE